MSLVRTATWAKCMREQTDAFKRHLYVPAFWDDTGGLQQMVRDMFGNFNMHEEPPVLRVYVSKGQRFDLEAKLMSAGADTSLPFERWIANAIGKKRFCVTLNGLTKWSNKFHLLLHQRFVRPLLMETGTPLGGLDFYAFIGNYGFTPFGIHDDGEHSFLIHLGDAAKSVYLWPSEVFLERGGKPTSNFNFRALARWAVHYTLRPGDLLFIPKGVYHVLNSTGFSITLGFTVFPFTRASQIVASLQLLYERLPARELFFGGATNWENTVRKAKLQLNDDALTHQLWRYRLGLKSNGYATTSPREGSLNDTDLLQEHFQVPRQFKIYSREASKVLEIFVRGRELRLPNTRRVRELIQFLNLRKPFKYAQFRKVLGCEWTEPAIWQIFTEFYNARAFCLVPDLPI